MVSLVILRLKTYIDKGVKMSKQNLLVEGGIP
jgi:hypothetical protein